MATETAKPQPKNSKSSNYLQQTVQNRMLVIVLGMVVFVPLLAMPTNTAMQGVANYALRLMAALLAGILVMRAKFATNKNQVITFFAMGANLPVLLLILDAALSLAIVPKEFRWSSAVDFMRIFTGVLLYFALAYHVRRSEHLAKIQDALVSVAAIISFVGLLNLAVGIQTPQAGKPGSLFGDHQLYGAMMMMLFPVTLVAAITEKQRWRQIVAQSVAALTFICLIITETRTSWAGAIAEVVALIVFTQIVPKRNNQDRPANRVQYIIPALIVLTCAGLFIGLGGAEGAFGSRLNAASSQAALDYRRRMWYAAGEMIKSSPVIGHGLGSFARQQADYSLFGRDTVAMASEKGRAASLGENAHSFWLQTGAEQGIVGMCIFAGILLTFLVAGVRRLRYLDAGIRRFLLLGSMAAVIGFAVDGLGNPAWEFAQIAMFFWLMLGLGVAALRPRNPRGDN